MENLKYEYLHDKRSKPHIWHAERKVKNGVPDEMRNLHFHRCVEIHYVTAGSERVRVENETMIADEDDIVFIHNYYRHDDAAITDHGKYVMIIPFAFGNDFDGRLKKETLPPLLSDKEFNRTLKPIFTLLAEQKAVPPLVLKGYLNVILGSLFDHYPLLPLEGDSSMMFLASVLGYIDENYASPLTLESISEKFGYNKCYFSRVFNRYIGENLNNYVNLVRLQRLVPMAREGTAQISSLAFACGFDSLSTFYRCFNKVYGCSPKTYFAGKAQA